MPSFAKQEEQILNDLSTPEIRQNTDPSIVSKTMEKMNINDDDLEAWRISSQNPEMRESLQVRNKIYDKIRANEVSDPSTAQVSSFERMMTTNILDNDQIQQRVFLESRGYDVRTSMDGDLQVRKKGTKDIYTNVDPEGFDKFDLSDFGWQVFTGLTQMIGAAVGGGSGTIAGPPGTLLGASIGSAATSALEESAKQSIAIKVGARKEYNDELIAEAAVIGSAMPAIGNFAKLAGRGIAKAGLKILEQFDMPINLKNNWQEIINATKKMGGVVTPGQIHDNRLVNESEDMLLQNAWTFAGKNTRAARNDNFNAAKNNAALILQKASGDSQYNIGSEIKSKIVSSIEEKLAPATAVYDKFDAEVGKSVISDKMIINVKKMFGKAIEQEARTNRDAAKAVYSHWDMFNKQALRGNSKGRLGITIQDLRNLRTDIGQEAADAFVRNETQKGKSLMFLYHNLTDARSQAIESVYSEVDPIKGKLASKSLKIADDLYAKTMGEVENLLGTKGKKLDSSALKAVDRWSEKIYPIDRGFDLFPAGAVDRAKKISQDFPEVFALIKLSAIEDLYSKSINNTTKEIVPSALNKALQPYLKNPERGKLIFGDEGFQQIKDYTLFIGSMPSGRLVGPSGTPGGLETYNASSVSSLFANPVSWLGKQIDAAGKGALLKALTVNSPGIEHKYLSNAWSGVGYMVIPEEYKHDAFDFLKDKIENLDTSLQGDQ